MFYYFSHGFHTLSAVKHLKAKIYSNLVRSGVLEVKKFKNH